MIARCQNYFFILPAVLSVIALTAIVVFGLKPGIDLSGGSLLQVSYPTGRPSAEEVRAAVAPLDYGQILVQPTGENDYLLRQRTLSPEEKNALMGALADTADVREVQFNSIGPSIGADSIARTSGEADSAFCKSRKSSSEVR